MLRLAVNANEKGELRLLGDVLDQLSFDRQSVDLTTDVSRGR